MACSLDRAREMHLIMRQNLTHQHLPHATRDTCDRYSCCLCHVRAPHDALICGVAFAAALGKEVQSA